MERENNERQSTETAKKKNWVNRVRERQTKRETERERERAKKEIDKLIFNRGKEQDLKRVTSIEVKS